MKKPIDLAMIVIASSLLIIVASGGWSIYAQSLLNEASAQRNATMQTYEQLIAFKERWSHSDEVERKHRYLLTHPALIRQEQRQKTILLEYANLSEGEFDQLISLLMNAPFVITKLTLTRSVNVGSISVEIEK